jgi:hypothetical protein
MNLSLATYPLERRILELLTYVIITHGAPVLPNADQPKISFRRRLLELAKANQGKTLRDLYGAAKQTDRTLTEETFVDEALALFSEGAVTLEETIPTKVTYPGYLSIWYANVWLYIALAVSALTIAAAYFLPNQYPVVAVRWVTGSVFILFLPGYVTVRALFPKRELDDIESLALSIGLSLALVPLLTLVLNYTPWGIRLEPIIITLTTYTALVAFAASWRKYQLLQGSNHTSKFEEEIE